MRHPRQSRTPRPRRRRAGSSTPESSPACIDLPEFELPLDLLSLVSVLLNKRADCPEFSNLIQSIGNPIRQYETRSHRFYDFHQCGLNLSYCISHEEFDSIVFHFDTAGVRSGHIKPYVGDLPAGIKWTDSCSVAEHKLGTKPERVGWVAGCDSASCDARSRASDFWQHYDVPPFHYTLVFESDQGGLGMVSMRPIDPEKTQTQLESR
jgi:hypothetical protein